MWLDGADIRCLKRGSCVILERVSSAFHSQISRRVEVVWFGRLGRRAGLSSSLVVIVVGLGFALDEREDLAP